MTKLTYIVLIIASVVGAFYWYEIRPTRIRQDCAQQTEPEGSLRQFLAMHETRDDAYRACLQEHGLTD